MYRTIVVAGAPAVGKTSFTSQFECQIPIHDMLFEDFKKMYPETTRYVRCVEGIAHLVEVGEFKYIFVPTYRELRDELAKNKIKYITVSHDISNEAAVYENMKGFTAQDEANIPTRYREDHKLWKEHQKELADDKNAIGHIILKEGQFVNLGDLIRVEDEYYLNN